MRKNSLRYCWGQEHPNALTLTLTLSLTLTLALTLMSGCPWRQNSQVKRLASGCPASKKIYLKNLWKSWVYSTSQNFPKKIGRIIKIGLAQWWYWKIKCYSVSLFPGTLSWGNWFRVSKKNLGWYLCVLVKYLCNRSPKVSTKNLKLLFDFCYC